MVSEVLTLISNSFTDAYHEAYTASIFFFGAILTGLLHDRTYDGFIYQTVFLYKFIFQSYFSLSIIPLFHSCKIHF